MTRLVLLIAAMMGLSGCGTEPEPLTNLTLVWEDNFDGAAGQLPNPANWKFDVGTDWGNAQLEYDTDRASNASLDGNGHLVITARQEAYMGSDYTSARITTEGRHQQEQGRFEARIRIPTSRGIWPAFWLLGANLPSVGWPQSGEIDVMENFGYEPSKVQGALHGPGYSGGNALTRAYTLPSGRFDADFHTFAVEWSADEINWFVDSTLYFSVKAQSPPGAWVFDHPFYLILNLAVGGGPPGPPDASTVFPQTMLVDWVRVYSAK